MGTATRGMEAMTGGAGVDRASGAWVNTWVRGAQRPWMGMGAKTRGLHGMGALDLLLLYQNERHTRKTGGGVHTRMPCH